MLVIKGHTYPIRRVKQEGIEKHPNNDAILADYLHESAGQGQILRDFLAEPAVVRVSAVPEQGLLLEVYPFKISRLKAVERANVLIAIHLFIIVDVMHPFVRQSFKMGPVLYLFSHKVKRKDVDGKRYGNNKGSYTLHVNSLELEKRKVYHIVHYSY